MQIAIFLLFVFADLGMLRQRLGAYASARDPDLVVHSKESRLATKGRSEASLFWGEPNPLIVIEVVSPGTESSANYKRDYEQKPAEYADRKIAEFWLIDAERAWVKVGALTDGTYRFVTFTGPAPIKSPAFPALNLTADQILAADEDE